MESFKVTGRRLIDEMINIGAYYITPEGKDCDFNEYVMPYGKVRIFSKVLKRKFGYFKVLCNSCR